MRRLLRLLPRTRPEAFAKKAKRYLVRRGLPAASIRYDEEEFALVADDQWFFLMNAYDQYHRLWPWKRGQVLANLANLTGVDPFPDTDDAMGVLLPGVRHIGFFDSTWLLADIQHPNRPHREKCPALARRLGEHLGVGLFLDSPASMQGVGPSKLDKWGLTLEAAFERALDNLAKREPKPLEKLADGLYVSAWQDCYDTARLLLDDTFRGLDLPGDPVVVAPTWTHLVVTGDDCPGLLMAALTVSEKIVETEGRPTSCVPLVRRQGAWETLELPRGHGCEPSLRRLRAFDLVDPYADQKRLIDKIHERDGTDIFVATFTGLQNKDTGHTYSYCTWTKGVEALLPRADVVFFGDLDRPEGSQTVGRFAWDVVWHHCHELMEPTEHVLPRFRVRSFPAPAQLEAMALHQQTRDQP